MTTTLGPDDFAGFFSAVNGHPPFPWQERLARSLIETGEWPAALALPTGSGKTAALDVALFHLATEADVETRRAAVRIVFVVDRRLVVDDAYARAERLAGALEWAQLSPATAAERADAAPAHAAAMARVRAEPVVAEVAARLSTLAGPGARPLLARRLRGGIAREDDWTLSPCQPVMVSSTIDQIGSRLLFRGYGVSDSMKPVHAGLLGSDCLVLLDEAHLARPFLQTLRQVAAHQGERWRDPDVPARPLTVVPLSATPGDEPERSAPFALEDADRIHPVLTRRLTAPKPVRLVTVATKGGPKEAKDADAETEDRDRRDAAEAARIEALVSEAEASIDGLREAGTKTPAVAIVVNRVARARTVFDRLVARPDLTVELMIGPARPVDREDCVERLRPLRTGAVPPEARPTRDLAGPTVIVATQTIEAGVDVDFDAVVSDLAPLDALVQRFGRLDRDGAFGAARGVVVAAKSDLAARFVDPVYGRSLRPTWDWLRSVGTAQGAEVSVDFGLAVFEATRRTIPPPREVSPPTADAPVLMPAHVDLLSRTAPIPAPDPEVALWLHGIDLRPADVTVVWRGDVEGPATTGDEAADERIRRLLLLVPPRSGEAIDLPLAAVRRWLDGGNRPELPVADVGTADPEEEVPPPRARRLAYRWRGDLATSRWIASTELAPGDTIVVPATHGGLDRFGWKPTSLERVEDVAERVEKVRRQKRSVRRLAVGLLLAPTPISSDETTAQAADRRRRDAERRSELAGHIAAVLTEARSLRARDLAPVVEDLIEDQPEDVREAWRTLLGDRRLEIATDVYPFVDGAPSGLVAFVRRPGTADAAATEDDRAGSLAGFEQELEPHLEEVGETARRFAEACGLPEPLVADLALAGRLHDLGKADARFQARLAPGDPLGGDPSRLLAKSAATSIHLARRHGLPAGWRHEALSVRMALAHPLLGMANDPELVVWLIGTHHGHGRPFFPHADEPERTWMQSPLLGHPIAIAPGPGPQSLAFDLGGTDWAGLFDRVRARHGAWGLARLEAILRLADHRASEAAARRADATGRTT
jgi:CRISPR-associated endonuclease/helicase Cas3